MITTDYDGIAVSHCLTPDDLTEVKARLRTSSRVAFDLETHTRTHTTKPGDRNTEEWHPSSRVVAISLSWDGDSATVIPLNHPAAPWYSAGHTVLRQVADAMSGCLLIAHNGKFDLRWIDACTKVDLADRLWWDTMLASHILDETTPNGLKPNAAPLAPGGVTWGGLPMVNLEAEEWTPLARYAGFDTAMTWRLFEQQYAAFRQKENTRLAVLFRKVPMQASRVLTRAERRGMKVDMERLLDALSAANDTVDQSTKVLMETAEALGVTASGRKVSFEPTALFFRETMDTAVREGMIEGLERTAQGKWSWRKGVRAQLRDEFPLAATLDDFRNATKEVQFLTDWRDRADRQHRIHGSWRIHGTSTGRLSSAGPNMQQVKRTLKPIFTAPPGYLFVELDYSQVELRVGAFVSRCEPMLEAFREGRDLHTMMGAIAAGVPEGEVTKEQRQRAKALNFGFIYGMQAAGFVTYARETYGVDVTLEEARALRGTFFSTWHGLEAWHNRSEWFAYENLYIESPLGRRRRLADAQAKGPKQGDAMRQAINSPVQAMASDLMLMSLDAIDRKYRGDARAFIVGTVHDSVLLEVREDAIDSVVPDIANLMMYPDLSHFGVSLDVPLVVDATIGTHWADPQSYELEFTT